jgi:hypothetical protein
MSPTVSEIIASVESAVDTYYFRFGYGRAGLPCLTLLGNGLELDEEDISSTRVYKASAIGISLDEIHTYQLHTETLNDHICAYGHHEHESDSSEKKMLYNNMRYAIHCIEDTWNSIAESIAVARG